MATPGHQYRPSPALTRKQWVEEHIVVIFIVFFAILIIPIAVGRVKRIKYEIDTSEAFRFDNAQKINKKKKQEG